MKRAIFVILLLAGMAFAKNKREYPLTGTVISFHAQAETGAYMSNGTGFAGTYERRVYVVKTDSGTIEITGYENNWKARKRPALAIGQTLTYRSDNKYIYMILEDGKEHRFYLMSAEGTNPQ